MMHLHAVVMLFDDLNEAELTAWIERRWVRPTGEGEEFVFQEIDIARVRLIHDLRRGMAVAEETMPLVLSLLDQVHDLRAALSTIGAALEGQPAAIHEIVRNALGRCSNS